MKKRSRNRPPGPPLARKLSGVGATLFTGCVLAAGSAPAQTTNGPVKPVELSPPSDTSGAELNNWIETGLGGNLVSGNRSQYQQQSGLPTGAYGGITSFHYEQPVDKTGLFSIDGHGIFDNHDYSVKMEVAQPDKGYFRIGYTEFREYYDVAGGYFPTATGGLSFPSSTDYIGRGDAFVEAGLTAPDLPRITFRYDHMTREGDADSTSWGTTLEPNGTSQIKITPAYLGINDTRDLYSLDLSRPFGNTEVGLGLRGELDKFNDSYNVLMEPTTAASGNHVLTQDLIMTSGTIAAHATTDTKLTDNLRFTTGYSFSSMSADLTGGGSDSPAPPTAAATDGGRYLNLAGALDLKEYVANFSVLYNPCDTFSIVPAVRVRAFYQNGDTTDQPETTAGVVYGLTYPSYNPCDDGEVDLSESLDLRYVGITNWAFYARPEFAENQGNINQASMVASTALGLPYTDTYENANWSEIVQKYAVGANWYPARSVSLGFQYYHKVDGNRYVDVASSNPAQYPAFIGVQNFIVDDLNFRVNWRVCKQLALVTRYDFEISSVETQPFNLPKIQSGEETRHMLEETLSWTPLDRLFVQVGINYVLDHTITPAQDDPVTSSVVLESKNNYYTGSCTVGYAIDKKTSLQATYSYYRSDDYMDNAPAGLPLGAGGRETNVSVSLRREINKKWQASLRYAFADYDDQLFGGTLNFKANSVLATLRYRF